jgi:hypothetical protein
LLPRLAWQNLAQSALASLTVGATDPPSLAAALRAGARCVLPRVSLLGDLRRVSDADADYVRRRAAAAHATAAPSAPPTSLEGLHPFRMDTECVTSRCLRVMPCRCVPACVSC